MTRRKRDENEEKSVSTDEHVARALGPNEPEEEGNATDGRESGGAEAGSAGGGPGVVTNVNYANREGASTEVDLDQ